MNFKVLVTPDEGYWAGGRFVFSIAIPAAYPHEAPKVHCDTRVRFPSPTVRASWLPLAVGACPAAELRPVVPRRCTTQTSTWRGTCA